MNDIFSFSRFGLLLKTVLSSNFKKYSMWLVLIWGVLIALVCIAIINNYRSLSDPDDFGRTWSYDPVASFMEIIFFLSLFFTSAIAASMTMLDLSSKATRIDSLMLPATSFEKFLSRWCIFVPGYLLVFLISFQMIDWLRVGVEMMLFPGSSDISSLNVISLISTTEDGIAIAILPLLLIQSLYVLGSTVWPKNSLLKTTCALFIICTAITLLSSIIFGYVSNYNFNPSSEAARNFFVTLILSITVIDYVIAYFRYKEIEIIQRW